MSLREQISADLKEAMKSRDQLRVDTLRSIISAFTYKKVETGKDLTDEEEIAALQKQVKQRIDSIQEFTKAGRTELMEKEVKERDILAKYLPAQKSSEEIRTMVQRIINDIPAENRNQGSVMKAAMAQLKGVADGNEVRRLVSEELK